VDDPELLELMLDYVKTDSSTLQAGAYWKLKTINAFKELKRVGIQGFRSDLNGAATSYGDNPLIDLRNISNYGLRALFIKFTKFIYPYNKFFNTQVLITKNYFEEYVHYRSEYLRNLPRITELLERYQIPAETTKGACLEKGVFDGKIISLHYLQLLDTLDHVARIVDFKAKKSMFEIGGGFGGNVHLIITLYPNIKKIIYLDIPPNLYVGTQYLKSFYGEGVIDYRQTKSMDVIEFTDNDKLEIFCIVPSQIERVNGVLDFFYNANSFVEMPVSVIEKYSEQVERIINKDNGIISLISYDEFNNSTVDPTLLPKFFNRQFTQVMVPTLTPERFNYQYISY
jgi:putative sugar O-methyltransferase